MDTKEKTGLTVPVTVGLYKELTHRAKEYRKYRNMFRQTLATLVILMLTLVGVIAMYNGIIDDLKAQLQEQQELKVEYMNLETDTTVE